MPCFLPCLSYDVLDRLRFKPYLLCNLLSGQSLLFEFKHPGSVSFCNLLSGSAVCFLASLFPFSFSPLRFSKRLYPNELIDSIVIETICYSILYLPAELAV